MLTESEETSLRSCAIDSELSPVGRHVIAWSVSSRLERQEKSKPRRGDMVGQQGVAPPGLRIIFHQVPGTYVPGYYMPSSGLGE
jgi:hypothetical protein